MLLGYRHRTRPQGMMQKGDKWTWKLKQKFYASMNWEWNDKPDKKIWEKDRVAHE